MNAWKCNIAGQYVNVDCLITFTIFTNRKILNEFKFQWIQVFMCASKSRNFLSCYQLIKKRVSVITLTDNCEKSADQR